MAAETLRFVLVTLDHHAAAGFRRARESLGRELPGVEVRLHVAADWGSDGDAAERCRDDLARADLAVVTQIFLEDQIRVVRPALEARRDGCHAVVCALCAPELVRLTRMGGLDMGGGGDEDGRGVVGKLLARLRGKIRGSGTPGERQMKMLRRIPKLLRFVPGTAQDVRAYMLVLQYWLAASDENLVNLVRFLVDRYGTGPAAEPAGEGPRVEEPRVYPDVGLYHPDLPEHGLATDRDALPRGGDGGTVGLLLMRSYLLSGDTAHYDAVIRALEARDLSVLPLFTSGLDARPALDRYVGGDRDLDALVSLTGFSLVGGPAYHDTTGARDVLEALDVPYLCLQPLEFQTVEEWRRDPRGLNPLQATLMVALPELDGATGPTVFAGREAGEDHRGDARPIPERVERVADRVARMARLRRTPVSERRVSVVLFNFPPNMGNTGTAAFLSVFRSLHRLLESLAGEGYDVEVPGSPEELRRRVVEGNAERLGTPANVHARVPVDEHVRREPWLEEIEDVWGPAPGTQLTDGRSLLVMGERFGNVFVGVQPPFGWEGDPMRLLFEGGFAPTHPFAAFYRWIREDFDAHAAVHFGTHGAAEFMPGKQVGLSGECWPDRLVGDLPNYYVYAANNPSEGALAKRRTAATLLSHLTPPVGRAGLYRGLLELKGTLDRYRGLEPGREERRAELLEAIRAGAEDLDLVDGDADAWEDPGDAVERLRAALLELEYALVPHGLHVLGNAPDEEERTELLLASAECGRPDSDVPDWTEIFPDADVVGSAWADGAAPLPEEHRRRMEAACRALARHGRPAAGLEALGSGGVDREAARRLLEELAGLDARLRENRELEAILRALDGGFVSPAPGGDVLRNPDVLPTGRNLYGFDPYRVPTPFAVRAGRTQAKRILERRRADRGRIPESVAMVLWGTDNLKTDGEPVAQALALMGAEPRFDSYGRLAGARLVPLEELGRPRVDVVLTTSGIFRDLLPLQLKLLAEAAYLAASADEPPARNFVRKRSLAHAEALGCDLETAALRVFSNADGAYGANVNHMVEGGTWEDESELAETFLRRKGTAYDRRARSAPAGAVMRAALGGVELTYQNLESVELGVSDLDQYFDSLGGMTRAAEELGGEPVSAYVGDTSRRRGRVRTLPEQIDLEARTRLLNPRWYESMLEHGQEGVREIESRVTNTVGWSATTGDVSGWVYDRVADTYVLDEEMRRRLAELNPAGAARMADRLLEASDRGYWSPDPETLDALRDATHELEDRMEGITVDEHGADEVAA